ncbi:MAG: prepilin-type N-terminal cleavage/methylation domain-containing protein [Pseudomonas sp.]|uniref:PilW family protein n=1 Tax=Pseudomonas abieticivorans TaxID=2931382 RepID=UPI0020C16A0E|nr:prepilin-type N-terminal cleavage/methylation domain-containing protein [Pseudomonas sp. PIA16]MDE1168124.1 prepilin-type N-terminal cleavage/methylation domain-containing protein [Pseudomonas sp.]
MNRREQGFGLIELMVSMLIGLIVVLGVTQIFIAAKNTYLAQNASAAMQEDARYALSKMVQEIRMTGMFGCLATVTPDATAADFAAAYLLPISYVTTTVGTVTSSTLTLITADVSSVNSGSSTAPNWTVVTDCYSTATAYAGSKTVAGMLSFPVRKSLYTYQNNQLMTVSGGTSSVLINNVSAFSLLFGVASSSTSTSVSAYTATPTSPSLIRSVRISLTLTDPNARVKSQQFVVVAAMRNRLQ